MKSSNVHAFKERMNAACVIGIFMKTCDGSFIESSGKSGIDFCILDMEHGPVSYEHLPNLIRACECSGALPIVRVADNTEERLLISAQWAYRFRRSMTERLLLPLSVMRNSIPMDPGASAVMYAPQITHRRINTNIFMKQMKPW